MVLDGINVLSVTDVIRNLKLERTKKGIALVDMTRSSGLTTKHLDFIENGSEVNITLRELRAYCTALGYDVRIKFEEE